jgi:hypothetical protein
MKRFILASLLVLIPVIAAAQTPTLTGVRLDVYIPTDLVKTIDSQVFAVSVITCGLTPSPANAATVNPNKAEWVDTADTTKVCRMDVTQLINVLPAGNYVVRAFNHYSDGSIGGASTVSNPFTRFILTVPTGLRIVR